MVHAFIFGFVFCLSLVITDKIITRLYKSAKQRTADIETLQSEVRMVKHDTDRNTRDIHCIEKKLKPVDEMDVSFPGNSR